MKVLHIVMVALAIIYLAFTGFTAAVGLFADGGSVWERALISGLHPIAAISLLAVVLTPRAAYKWPIRVAFALLLVSIAGDVAAYLAISMGVVKGDAWLALAFAVIPALGLVYAVVRGTGQGPVGTPRPAS